jgi:hypothetical protein
LPLSSPVPRGFQLAAYVGRVDVKTASGLLARRGRAFLRAQRSERVEEALQVVKALRSFFAALGLADLEAALEVLAKLVYGEARTEGPHVLLREVGLWVLRTGFVLGDLSSTKDFLTRGRAVLSYPHGLEIALRGHFWWQPQLGLEELTIRWGNDVVRFGRPHDGPEPRADPLSRDPVGSMVRLMLEWAPRWDSLTPRVKTLIEELRGSESPLEAPKDPGFFRRLHLRTLSLS